MNGHDWQRWFSKKHNCVAMKCSKCGFVWLPWMNTPRKACVG